MNASLCDPESMGKGHIGTYRGLYCFVCCVTENLHTLFSETCPNHLKSGILRRLSRRRSIDPGLK